MVSKNSSQMGRVPLVTQNKNILILEDNGVNSILKKGAWILDLNDVIEVKKVCRLEFETQRCKVRNSTMHID